MANYKADRAGAPLSSKEPLKRGAPCKQFCLHGHDTFICGRRSSSGHCIECSKAADKKRYWSNPEKARLRTRVASRLWAKNNREESRRRCRSWKKNNPEQACISNRKGTEKYRKLHPDRRKASANKRRALKRNVTVGDLTEIAKVYSRAQELRNQGFDVQVDHIIPLAKDGTHEPSNLQILYTHENLKKHTSLTYKPEVVFT